MIPLRINKQRVAIAATVAIAALLLFFAASFDPCQTWTPKCLFKTMTGYDCPGCGTQRALHAALQAHWADAWRFNPALWCALPFIAACFCPYKNIQNKMQSPTAMAIILASILAWWILRNLI